MLNIGTLLHDGMHATTDLRLPCRIGQYEYVRATHEVLLLGPQLCLAHKYCDEITDALFRLFPRLPLQG